MKAFLTLFAGNLPCLGFIALAIYMINNQVHGYGWVILLAGMSSVTSYSDKKDNENNK